MKRLLTILGCLIAAALIVFGIPYFSGEGENSYAQIGEKERSLISQNSSAGTTLHEIHRIYDSGKLIGVLSSRQSLDAFLKEVYKTDYEARFPGSDISLSNDVFLASEQSYFNYENIDDKIFEYLTRNDLFTVRTTAVEFSDEHGVYAQIYVSDQQIYERAMETYLSYFVDTESLRLLRSGQSVPELKTYGSHAVGITVSQNVEIKEDYAKAEEIMTDEAEVLEYIEYSGHTEKEYYTVQKYDTVAGVGSKNGGLSATQVMNINRDKISSTDQVLSEGEQLCVTYFDPIFDVTVTMERMKKEEIYPETIYTEDETLREGKTALLTKGISGSKNSLYSEKWINGVLVSGTLVSSVDTLQAVDEVIGVGTLVIPGVGTGTYRWPVENVIISCYWGCYWGHEAIDIQNAYNKWDKIYAADRGTVIENAYNYISGNYVVIDHGDGYTSYYGHMIAPSPIPAGSVVDKGDYIGDIGMTGRATGPHVHFYIAYNGTKLNPCNGFLDCSGMH
ncbi:MAG: peptidoglycan DD-metalloendopeptidase family protein [Solobacterium sp.]|nr:peptidoglycan DD-metalloendopeptidase family protein [Solobacterium sp.]MDO4193468.1 peptidoglycan DD-metalloendopeptidase family protein [Erysipelotrichaceae bacterium]